MTEEEIIKILDTENEEFKTLEDEHRSLEEKLSAIDDKLYLTPEEEMERKRIQKLKLQKKDRMAELIRQYKAGISNN